MPTTIPRSGSQLEFSGSDLSTAAARSSAVLAEVSSMIADGLIWVFVAMFGFSLLGVAVSFLMPRKKCDHVVSRTEALESIGG